MNSMVNMPRYTAYKDSGVEWLEKIPEGWEVRRFKFHAHIQKGSLPKKIVGEPRDGLPVYLSMDYLRGGIANQFVLDKNAKIVDSNEILLLWDGSNSGEFIKSRKGIISSTVALIKFKGILGEYAWYACSITESVLRRSTVGMGIPHVNGDELKNSVLFIPSPPEQQVITNFLDKKTGQIDEAIAIKEQQIELMKERKQIIIQQAVTRGLNPDAPLRDSGIDWIGQIPAHWEVKKIKYLASFIGGGTPSKERQDYWNGDICWVSPKDMKTRLITDSIDKITEVAVKNSSVKLVPPNTVLIVVRGMILAKKIPVALTTKPLTINQDIKGLIVESTCNPLYILNLLDGLHEELSTLLEESGHGTKTMPTGKLASFGLPYPSLEEQYEIIQFIDKKSSELDSSIALQQQQIALLKEYKTTLINSAVTGKIKVVD